MRTLMEITDAVLENQSATEEEVRYALIAFQSLATFDRMFLIRFAAEDPKDRPSALSANIQANECFKRWKRALAQDAKVWVGWNNDPANPEYQQRRKVALKIFEKAMKGELPNQKRAAAAALKPPPVREVVKGG